MDTNDVQRPQQSGSDVPSLRKRIEEIVSSGDLDRVISFIDGFSPDIRERITQPRPEWDDQGVFLAAVENNNAKLIRFLVEKCNANPEIRFFVKHGSTPLCEASKSGYFEAAQELIRLGANVNRASCGSTALLLGVSDAKVCRLLLESGADINTTDGSGNFSLHLAARIDASETVKLLLEYGADPLQKNRHGEDALHLASMACATSAVHVMIHHISQDDVKRQVEALQLLGAGLLDNDNDADAVTKTLSEWESAIELRNTYCCNHHVTNEKDDIVVTPNPEYDNAVEIDSISKLNEIRQDVNMIYMQGLLLKEKILGPTHDMTISSLIRRGNFYMENQDYGHGLHLLKRAFKFVHDRWLTTKRNFLYLDHVQEVCSRFHVVVESRTDFKDVYDFLEAVILVAKRSPTKAENVRSTHACDENQGVFKIALHLIKLLSRVTKNDDQMFQFKKLVKDFIRLDLRSYKERTLLMNAIINYNYRPTHGFSIRSIFLEVDMIKLLLDCGADASDRDGIGNSALHLLFRVLVAEHRRFGPRDDKEKQVAEALLSSGAHYDARNKMGHGVDFYLNQLGLYLSSPLTLQCLAAQVIRRRNIPYKGILPKCMLGFVEIH